MLLDGGKELDHLDEDQVREWPNAVYAQNKDDDASTNTTSDDVVAWLGDATAAQGSEVWYTDGRQLNHDHDWEKKRHNDDRIKIRSVVKQLCCPR
jgi:hypothetical protein